MATKKTEKAPKKEAEADAPVKEKKKKEPQFPPEVDDGVRMEALANARNIANDGKE